MQQYKPTAINPPLIKTGPVPGLQVGTTALFPGGQVGIVTNIGRETIIQFLGDVTGLNTNIAITFTNRPLSFALDNKAVIGRTVNAVGQVIDGRSKIIGRDINVYGEILNPTRRIEAEGFVQTGIPALDVKEPIPQGIKILWMKAPEESLDHMIARTMIRARYRRRLGDELKPLTVIFCGIGLPRESVLYFNQIREQIPQSVYVIHQASEPAIGALMAPHTACQIAEHLTMAGEQVLLMICDMRNFYDALAEVRGVQGVPPGKDNSPVDFYSQAARIYERAFIREQGSLTEIVVMSAPNMDESEIGINLTKYSTEGHILWRNGKLLFLPSLSRLKGDAVKSTRPDHKELQRALVPAYNRALGIRQMQQLGVKITNETDLAFLSFAKEFETKVLNTDEFLQVETALDRSWLALGHLPPHLLDISAEIKQAHHHFRKKVEVT